MQRERGHHKHAACSLQPAACSLPHSAPLTQQAVHVDVGQAISRAVPCVCARGCMCACVFVCMHARECAYTRTCTRPPPPSPPPRALALTRHCQVVPPPCPVHKGGGVAGGRGAAALRERRVAALLVDVCAGHAGQGVTPSFLGAFQMVGACAGAAPRGSTTAQRPAARDSAGPRVSTRAPTHPPTHWVKMVAPSSPRGPFKTPHSPGPPAHPPPGCRSMYG